MMPLRTMILPTIKLTSPLPLIPNSTFKKNFFLLDYSCFTMLGEFPLYSKVNQLYVYMELPFKFPSI